MEMDHSTYMRETIVSCLYLCIVMMTVRSAALTQATTRPTVGMFYPPGTSGAPMHVGHGRGVGYTVNIGWNGPGTGDIESHSVLRSLSIACRSQVCIILVWTTACGRYAAAFEYIIIPLVREFAPDMIVISAGFDSARGDPLGGCDVTPRGFAMMIHKL